MQDRMAVGTEDKHIIPVVLPSMLSTQILTAHYLYQAFRNRKSQARSPELASRGAVALTESFEDEFLFLRSDANASVFDNEMQSDMVLHPGLQCDLAQC